MMSTTETADWHSLEADIDRSIRYHKARERFFQFWSNAFAFVSLVSGSSVVVALLAQAPGWVAIAAGALVAIASALELVGNVGGKARLHAGLASDFNAVHAAMILADARNPATWRRLRSRVAEIEAREPPVKRWLDIACHNEVAFSRGSRDVYAIGPLQRRLAQWIDLTDPQPRLRNR